MGEGRDEIIDEEPVPRFNPVTDIVGGELHHLVFAYVRDKDGNVSPDPMPVLVRSNRTFVPLTREDVQEKLGAMPRTLVLGELFERRWRVKSILEYLRGDPPNPEPSEILDVLTNSIRLYLELQGDMDYKLLALWGIGTYFQAVFDTYPYLMIIGPMRSGKSRTLRILSCFAYNPMQVVSITEAALFRTVELASPTLLMDETDFTDPGKKAALQQLLLAGYRKEAVAVRAEKKSSDRVAPMRYNVFCPKAIVAPWGAQHMLFDRSIVIQMMRSTDPQVTTRWVDTDDPVWADIRDHLYRLSLERWRDVRDAYARVETGLPAREHELWAPLIAVASLFGVEEELAEYAKQKAWEKAHDELMEMDEVKLLRVLLKLRRESGFDEYFSARAIADAASEIYPDEKWTKAQQVGKMMTNTLGFRTKPLKVVKKGVAHYKLDWARLKKIAEKYGVDPENPLGEE